ncbi:MAG: hypothetical protein LUF89_05840, partial [Ruminococcus sp.]|nr:hypothetical protein [Ruminococcus sp.]
DTSDSTTESTTESTTDSSDTTDSTTDTTTDTTVTDPIPVEDIESVAVVAGEDVYFSYAEEYDVTALIESVTLTLTDGSTVEIDEADFATVITFLSTPAKDYESVAEVQTEDVYYLGTTAIVYTDADGNTLEIDESQYPTVGVALKGDVNLNGQLDNLDGYVTKVYFSELNVDNTATFTDGDDAFLEKLVYFVADVDTESKNGENDIENGLVISAQDGYHIQIAFAEISADDNYSVFLSAEDWKEILAI